MGYIRRMLILYLIHTTSCMDQLNIKYEWNQLDFDYPSPEIRKQDIDSGRFIPENNIPMGVEAYEDRLFVSIPRWKNGVASSLNYIDLKDNSTTSPKLKPYPSWAAHSMVAGLPEIISPFRVRADRCGRLWVLDSGKIGILEANFTKNPPALIVYDLKTDTLIRKYVIPADQVKEDSGFANIAVEDRDCEDTYAYAADAGKAGIVVYSWKKNDSWRITHHFFNIDPIACDFSVKGLNFSWTDALFGIGISGPDSNNFSTLYFHPMSSYNEFAVSTEYLRNETIAKDNFHAFKSLGSRGTNAQSSVSFLDQSTGVLFYSLVNLNSVACWRTSNAEYNMKNQGRIFMSDETMVFPTDIKVDYNHTLWILSNKLPIWMYSKLNASEVNFRIFSAPVLEAISYTACDVTPRSDILDKVKKGTKKILKAAGLPGAGTAMAPLSLFTAVMMSIACLLNYHH